MTDRREVTLKTMGMDDLEFLCRLVNDPEVTKFIGNLIRDKAELGSWIDSLTPDDHEYVVLKGNVPIGECSLTEHGDSGEIGYMLLPEYWRQGYGTTVVEQLLSLAHNLGLEAVTAATDKENIGSVQLLLKTGFQPYGMGWMLTDDELESMKPGRTVTTYRKMLGQNK